MSMVRTGIAARRTQMPLDKTRFRVPSNITGQGDLFAG